MTLDQTAAPNHHAHYPGFAGLTGYFAAAIMVLGRERDARLAATLSGLTASDAVVDVGCGPGTAVRHAARLGASVVGVDPAMVMLRVARLLTGQRKSVRYLQGSAEILPLPDVSVSVLWSIATVHHWADLEEGLREARRVLRPGGRIVAIERTAHSGAGGLASHGWTYEQAGAFADRCREHGFIDPRVESHESRRRTTVSVSATAPAS